MPAIDPYVEVIDSWLLADRKVPRKQRHTARRVWQRLVAERGASVAKVTVSRYVARRRVELGLDKVVVAVPQTHLPGAEGEVDFGEFYATIDGTWTRVCMFVMRLSHSGKALHIAYVTQAQEGVPGRARAGVRPPRRRPGPDPARQAQGPYGLATDGLWASLLTSRLYDRHPV